MLIGDPDGPPRPAPATTVTPIGQVRTAYHDQEHTPSQAAEAARERGRVVIFPRFRAGLRGIENCRHLWLITHLDQQPEPGDDLEVVPRKATDGQRYGVFATRSPYRPNRLGLSLITVTAVRPGEIDFTGVDLLDGTPVLDLKPWVAGIDVPPGDR